MSKEMMAEIHDDENSILRHSDMNLRDWFAGNIVANMFAHVKGAKDEDEAAMMCARMAYKAADAMLEARK